MRNSFTRKEGFLSSDLILGGVHIYFRKPHELRQYEQGGGNGGGGDVGVSNRIQSSAFKALRFGYYDDEKRILNLPKGEGLTLSDIPQILKLQEEGVVMMDNSLLPLPPLKGIFIQDASQSGYLGSTSFALPGYHHVSPFVHPELNGKTINEIKVLMREGKLEDNPSTLDQNIKENYTLNLMLANQQKSLAMIQEMGGIRSVE